MKVWIVYGSDDMFMGAFSTEELAQEFIAKHNGRWVTEEYEVDSDQFADAISTAPAPK